MVFRIGSFLFYPHGVLLPFAAAFFLVIGHRRLYPGIARSRRESFVALGAAGLLALAGSWIWNGHGDALDVVGPQASFAGYWGALLGGALWARIAGRSALRSANAVAGGVMAGGTVARVGCLFAGCCPGAAWLPLFQMWPLLDILAILATLAIGLYVEKRRPWGMLVSFLVLYGVLRFGLEFLRAAPAPLWGLTASQVFAAVQFGVGVLLVVMCKGWQKCSEA